MAVKRISKTKTGPTKEIRASQVPEFLEPKFVGEDNTGKKIAKANYVAGPGGTRSGRITEFKNKDYHNLENFSSPFSFEHGFLDTRRAVHLCVQAYWAFPLLRNVIEVMVELSNSRIFLKGGNKTTRDFISKWFEKIGFWHLKEEFFREWFRSGNVFLYRFDGTFTGDELQKLGQVWGMSKSKVKIPIRYLVINPEVIRAGGNINFVQPYYFKLLNPYEIERLRYPETDEDKQVLESLSPEDREMIKNGSAIRLKLDAERLSIALYKAQSYEPMGVPLAYGLLDDIEAKLEMKRLDLAAARMMDRALLLITAGETPTEYNPMGLNPNTLASLQAIFGNESITRTLVADWTVKGQWLIPDTSKILGPERYIQLDKDINIGLNAILFDTKEKFANTSIKVQVFIERLKEARNAFLNTFLQPEIKKICKMLNAKTYPEPHFEEISLKDELEYAKLATQLYSVGLLTPEETFDTFDTGKFPTMEQSLIDQKAFKEQRDEGLYMPVVGGSTTLQGQQMESNEKLGILQQKTQQQQFQQKMAKPAGRPSGTKAPQTTKKVSPIGGSENEPELSGFSLSKMKDVYVAVGHLQDKTEAYLRKKHKLKILSQEQQEVAKFLVSSIIGNEPKENWESKIAEYSKAPKEINEIAASEMDDIGISYGTDSYTSAILRLCKTHG